MEQQDSADAVIELGLFINKLKGMIQKYPEGTGDEDRSKLILAKMLNEVILESFTKNMTLESLFTQFYSYFRQQDYIIHKR